MKVTRRWYTVAWLLWLAVLGVIEGSALFNNITGDTLSEHDWAWFHVFDPDAGPWWALARVGLGVFLLWLAAHMTFGWFTPSHPVPGRNIMSKQIEFRTPQTPTQTRHPWRATARTVAAATVGLLSLLPWLAATAHVDTVPAVAQVLAVTGLITRILAYPAVDAWVRRYVPWLAASPSKPY